ncbi:hypothetical protein V494_01193 [Pseudogymnoascus sp. VKM F-4513 (FW-928)]|nr:hypothetical protein V494_01193 [Pseudogymnoascus sp. VKM F-4513 (FW-928)]
MRLDIRCEATTPSFKFVGDAASSFNAGRASKQRVSRWSETSIRHRKMVSGRKNGGCTTMQTSSVVSEDGNCATVLERPLPSDRFVDGAESPTAKEHQRRSSQLPAQSTSPTLQARSTNSPSLRSVRSPISSRNLSAAHMESGHAVNPESTNSHHTLISSLESGEFLPLSGSADTSGTVKDPLRAAADDSSQPLVAWFSSFVDMGPSLASATLDEGPPTTEAEEGFCELQEQLYLHHWRTHVLRTLPAPFAQVENLADRCSALRPAIIALSACDLAQTRADVRQWTIQHEKRWLLSPNREHQQYGKIYYNLALQELAHMDYSKQELTSLLVTLMLFTHIESHVGSFRGAAFHHHGVEHLLSARHGLCKQSVLATDLARIWTSLRAQNWRCRIAFTVPDFQRSLADLGLEAEQLLNPSEARDEAVMVNMLQSWRLSLMILFERYAGRGDMETISSRCCQDYYARIPPPGVTRPWRPKEPIPDEDYEALLGEQRKGLDRWYAALPTSHLPRQSLGPEISAQDSLQLGQPPLQFLTHQAAMNYVYYVAARIFQSREVIDEFLALPRLHPHHSAQPDNLGVDGLLRVLLRIIIGVDVMVCARHSSYSVGILEILHMCHLRLPRRNQIIRGGVQYMITGYANNCITHEGSGLVLGFQHVFEEIEEQRNLGRDLFYIIPRFSPDCQRQLTYDDTTPYVVYGRDKTTGKFFCQILPPRRKVP